MSIFERVKILWKDIFSFRPPRDAALEDSPSPLINDDIRTNPEDSLRTGVFKTTTNNQSSRRKYFQAKIKFDNAFRLIVSTIAFTFFILLWSVGVAEPLGVLISIFLIYGVIHLLLNIYVRKGQKLRTIDLSVCSWDLIGLSFAIYFTGGIDSSFYFLFFVPLLIQSYHRDWVTILLYGFGGVFLYSVVLLFSVSGWTTELFWTATTRVVFMLLTVSIATGAVHLLRKQESKELIRLSRMRTLTEISHILNSVTSVADLKMIIRDLVSRLNDELQPQLDAWLRVFLTEPNRELMVSYMDPRNVKLDLKQELPIHSCPALESNRVLQVNDSKSEDGCPTEQFSFLSHICIPISGAENETFGIIFSGSTRAHAFNDEEKGFLEFIGRAIGLTYQRLNRMKELNKIVEMDSCVTATFLKSTRSVNDAYRAILEGVHSILKADQVSLLVWEKTIGLLVGRDVIGDHNNRERGIKYQMGEGIPGKVLESGEHIWTRDIDSEPKFKDLNLPFKTLLSLPLFNMKSETIGVINAWIEDPDRNFSPFEVDIASTFVTRAAVAIENARLHKAARENKPPKDLRDKAA